MVPWYRVAMPRLRSTLPSRLRHGLRAFFPERLVPLLGGVGLALLLPGFGPPASGVAPAGQLAAQVPQPSASVADLGLLLRQLGDERRVLMVAAHPDDEDTALLTALSRGEGARVAYLSLTRGEGGQNLVGPEMDEALGLLRTGELLSARQLDGAVQYFSRAYDFGFSRSADETLRLWGEEEILEDMVRLVRTIRPQVLVSVFHGTPRDGHGHHQAAGLLTLRAFGAAADPDRFPHLADEGLAPWEVTKLYRLLWNDPPTSERLVATGTLDPLLGRSHFQVAMASRSRHRSQDMGVAEWPGALASRLELVESRGFGTSDPDAPLFQGVATSLLTLAELAGGGMEISRRLQGYDEALSRARAALHPEHPERTLPHLLLLHDELAGALHEARRSLEASGEGARAPWAEVVEALTFREARLGEALLLAAGVLVEARVDRPLLVPGARPEADVLIWNAGDGSAEVTVDDVRLDLPAGWRSDRRPDPGIGAPEGLTVAPPWALSNPAPPARRAGSVAAPGGGADRRTEEVSPGELLRWDFFLEVPEDAELPVPHFLRLPRAEGRYAWPSGDPSRGRPLDPPPVQALVRLRIAGRELLLVRTAHHVRVDKALGELREPVHRAPVVSVELARSSMAWPLDDREPREIRVRVRNLDQAAVGGELRLLPSEEQGLAEVAGSPREPDPDTWRVEPAVHRFTLSPEIEEEFAFFLLPPASPVSSGGPSSPAVFEVVATLGGRPAVAPQNQTFRLVDYPHIEAIAHPTPARLEVHRFDVTVRPGLRVGWVEGPGDGGPEALEDLGLPLRRLDAAALRAGAWEELDVVVLGSRSYETRPDLVAATPRLHDWARRGGVVVSLYHKYEFPEGDLAPWPVQMSRPHDRITDPASPVVILAPEHPVMSSPNLLSDQDFHGWVQERGLYFLSAWEGPFTPLLELRDPGLDPVRGGLLVAPLGAGAYVYTGLALFRQWPRGVAGAFRILANLVSLDPAALEDARPGALSDPRPVGYSAQPSSLPTPGAMPASEPDPAFP